MLLQYRSLRASFKRQTQVFNLSVAYLSTMEDRVQLSTGILRGTNQQCYYPTVTVGACTRVCVSVCVSAPK